jgi:hypothetical protein
MKRLVLISLIAILVQPIFANQEVIKSGLQGTWWRDFSDREKLIYLKGLYSGIMWGDSKDKKQFILNTSLETVEDSLDEFYEEPANRNIIIIYALKVVSAKLRGTDADTIEKMTLGYRKSFSK